MKMTSTGRQPQNIKSWISQHPLIGSYSNFKFKLRGPNQIKNTQNEVDLKWKTTLIESSLTFQLKLKGLDKNKKMLEIKMTNPWHNEVFNKTIYDRRWSQNKKGNMWFKSSKGEIRRKHRGNLECGSAQPSLFCLLV